MPLQRTWNVSGAEDARGKTRQLIDEGVDWIKILNAEQLAPEEMTAIVSEAHAHGRKVAAHAFSDGEIRQGLRAGGRRFPASAHANPDLPS